MRADFSFRDPDAVPGLSVLVRVLDPDGRLAGFARTFPENERLLACGRRLPPGSCRLDCNASDGRKVEASLTVGGEAPPSVTIDLPQR